MKELICIVCPKGCHLKVDENNDYAVTGNGCPRGAEYGKAELTNPTRVVTSTVRCLGGTYPRCPVKTDGVIPKGKMFEIMERIHAAGVEAPVKIGDVILSDVFGAEIIATKELL
jgi:CxxC motif-containing protein